jgi:uncharacterized membrane protein YwaF
MQIALGCGSLVLLTAGVVAMVRRSVRPGQALGVLGIAVAVALVVLTAEWVADRSLGSFYAFLIAAPTTLAGMTLAAWLLTLRPRKIP